MRTRKCTLPSDWIIHFRSAHILLIGDYNRIIKASHIRVYTGSLFIISGIIPRALVHPAEFCEREATHTGLVEKLHCTCHISSGNHCLLVDGQNKSDGGPTSCVHKVCDSYRRSFYSLRFHFSEIPVTSSRQLLFCIQDVDFVENKYKLKLKNIWWLDGAKKYWPRGSSCKKFCMPIKVGLQ